MRGVVAVGVVPPSSGGSGVPVGALAVAQRRRVRRGRVVGGGSRVSCSQAGLAQESLLVTWWRRGGGVSCVGASRVSS